jgi:hypothetical protein
MEDVLRLLGAAYDYVCSCGEPLAALRVIVFCNP